MVLESRQAIPLPSAFSPQTAAGRRERSERCLKDSVIAIFQPPPTWASPILIDEKTKQSMFNPIWLKWFLDLVGVLNASGGGGGGIAHNSTTGLQGGQASQYYHLTAAQHSALTGAVKVGSFTRVMDAGTGSVSYTGVGFQPNGVIFFCRVIGGTGIQVISLGFGTAAFNWFIQLYSTTGADFNSAQGSSESIWIANATILDFQRAAITSLDSDGFTLSWVKSGSPTNITATIGYMAIG